MMPTVALVVTKAAVDKAAMQAEVRREEKAVWAAKAVWQALAARLQGERRVARGKAQVETLALAEWE